MLRRVSAPPPHNALMNSTFKFRMLVNQLIHKCCPLFEMILIIILTCVESPVGLIEIRQVTVKAMRVLVYAL
jgi:hypothetical protein